MKTSNRLSHALLSNRILIILLILSQGVGSFAQRKLPVIRANSKTASIRDGKHFKKNYWAIMPEKRPDIYYTEIPGKAQKLTFITDQDSISFNVSYGENYDFIVLLNGKDTCYTRISATYKKPLLLTRIKNNHVPDTIPFTVSDRHKIHVKAKLNGSDELTVEVDLGAGGTVINKNHLKKVRIKFDEKITLANTDGINEVQSSSKNLLQIGNLTWDSVQVSVASNMKEYEDLIVGNYLFKDKVLELNYDKNTMIVHDALPAMAANYSRHDVILDYGVIPHLFVKLKVGEKEKEGWVMFDTGAQSTLLSSEDVGKSDGIFFEAAEMLGLNKSKRPTLTVNNQEFAGFQYRTRNTGSDGLNMILGNSLLKRFNLILDNRNGHMYLQPNSLQDAPYERNDGYYVVRVLAGMLVLLIAILLYKKLKRHRVAI